MAYRTPDASRQFDGWSRWYDRDPLQPLFFGPSHRMLLETLRAEEKRVLDVGCGTGRFAAAVRARFPGTTVVGLDLSGRMLGRAVVRSEAASGGLHLVQADSGALPFADDSFDAVTCAHSFHHYPRQKRVLGEVHRVLRPGGRLLLIDGDRDRWWGRFVFDVVVVLVEGRVRHLRSRTLRHLYRRAGFEAISQRRRRGPLPFLMTVGRAVKPAPRAA
jgi:ubiquinone/menaquinone biosynthesis C-methylase UbiE